MFVAILIFQVAYYFKMKIKISKKKKLIYDRLFPVRYIK
jgi:hypothetical protein